MKAKWIPISAVLALLCVVGVFKDRVASRPAKSAPVSSGVRLLLAATSAEAASPTRCGQIVHLVRSAAVRGVSVQELDPDRDADLMGRYHVFQTPTLIVLFPDGSVKSRYEGEAPETLAGIRSELAGLR